MDRCLIERKCNKARHFSRGTHPLSLLASQAFAAMLKNNRAPINVQVRAMSSVPVITIRSS